MYNNIVLGLFLIVTFLMYVSIIFNIVGKFIPEEKLFSSARKGLVLYGVTGIISAILTFATWIILCMIQT